MENSNSLSSTEKLLNTIRTDQKKGQSNYTSVDQAPQSGESFQKKIKHSLTAGVLIDDSSIALVLTGKHKQGTSSELIKWAYINIPEHLTRESEQFPSFLKATLSQFLGKYKKVDIWTSIDSKYLKLRNIVIPDVQESKIGNAAFWGLKKELELDPESEIFDYDYIGESQVNGVNKINVVAFSGERQQVELIKNQFSTAGYKLTGITTGPFALQNFIANDLVQVSSSPTIFVNVDRYSSEIYCLCDKGVLLTRSIRTGSHSLVEDLIASQDKEIDHSKVPELLSNIIDRQSPEFEHIEHPATRLYSKIVRTGDYCSNIYAANEPVDKFVIFGETDNCRPFMEYASENIPSKVEGFSPFEDQNSSLLIQMPNSAKERNRIIPAAGIALSSNEYTPNFLFTYQEKEISGKYKKINIVIAAICAICLIACAGVWGWFKTNEKSEINKVTKLKSELTAYDPFVTQNKINNLVLKVQANANQINQYANDYAILAIINEISSMSNDEIRITSLTADFDAKQLKSANNSKSENTKPENSKRRTVKLSGIVSAEYTALESTLSGYIIKLSDSPLFTDIFLEEKNIEKKNDRGIIKFKASMEIF